ncbi:MAG: RnfABCDGE type electron transport complex subunit G, partial [Candidatus Omnitrophota bacterium]|nr:RnfABCDGE type electron transport complex subunit G [Candidatus Omnitrophota bacterium]
RALKLCLSGKHKVSPAHKEGKYRVDKMRQTIRYGFTLAVICVVASGLLAGMNSLTKARIIAQAQAEEGSALLEVIPQGEYFDPIKKGEDIIYYKVSNKDGKSIGVTFKAYARGYSGTIETMVGMTKEGTIMAIKILNQNETPGLGNRIMELPFLSKFANKGISELAGVEAITGATISSKAVIGSVQEKAKEIQELIKDER